MANQNGSQNGIAKTNGSLASPVPVQELGFSTLTADELADQYRDPDTGCLPWEKQPWMTDKHYDAFRVHYLEQPRPRSLVVAYRTYKGFDPDDASKPATPSWYGWTKGSKRNKQPHPNAKSWAELAAAWDEYTSRLADQAWVVRKAEIRQREWDAGTGLLHSAEQIADLPLVREKVERELLITPDMVGKTIKQVVILEPMSGVTPQAQVALAKAASDLLRRAMHDEQDGEVNSAEQDINVVVKALVGVSLEDL